MKKLLALFLALAMLLPMGIVAQADEVETRPYYLIQWGNTLEEQTYVHSLPFFWVNKGYLKGGNILGCTHYAGT